VARIVENCKGLLRSPDSAAARRQPAANRAGQRQTTASQLLSHNVPRQLKKNKAGSFRRNVAVRAVFLHVLRHSIGIESSTNDAKLRHG